MPNLSQINCITTAANTGFSRCNFDPKRFQIAIAIPKGKTFSAADVADFQTTLKGLATADTPSTRVYRIGRFVGAEDNSSASQEYTVPYGGKRTLAPGIPSWTFQTLNGALCMWLNMAKFDGQQDNYDWLFVDAKNYVMGKWVLDPTDGVTHLFAGISMMDIHVPNWTLPTSSAPALFKIMLTWENADDMRVYPAFVQCGFNVYDALAGFEDVTLTATDKGGGTHGVYYVQGFLGCSNEALGSYYGTALAVTGTWLAYNGTTNAAITVSAVSYDAANLRWQITLDTTDTDYPAIGGALYLNLQAPSVLKSVASITGIESPAAVKRLAT